MGAAEAGAGASGNLTTPLTTGTPPGGLLISTLQYLSAIPLLTQHRRVSHNVVRIAHFSSHIKSVVQSGGWAGEVGKAAERVGRGTSWPLLQHQQVLGNEDFYGPL